MDVLLVLVVLAVAVLLIVGPLRTGPTAEKNAAESAERADLEAAKDSKYREIRDAELDYRTGKLSREDWRRLDLTLRAEAIELLRRLDALEGRESGAPEGER
jgi:hypothetical protein